MGMGRRDVDEGVEFGFKCGVGFFFPDGPEFFVGGGRCIFCGVLGEAN